MDTHQLAGQGRAIRRPVDVVDGYGRALGQIALCARLRRERPARPESTDPLDGVEPQLGFCTRGSEDSTGWDGATREQLHRGWSTRYGTPREALAELGPDARLAGRADLDEMTAPPPLTGVDERPDLERRLAALRQRVGRPGACKPRGHTGSFTPLLADAAAASGHLPIEEPS